MWAYSHTVFPYIPLITDEAEWNKPYVREHRNRYGRYRVRYDGNFTAEVDRWVEIDSKITRDVVNDVRVSGYDGGVAPVCRTGTYGTQRVQISPNPPKVNDLLLGNQDAKGTDPEV